VDLSSEFEEGGGTLALTVRLAQVVCTLDEFPTVDGVRFAIDGTVVDVFSGDGLIIDEPVACSDYAEVAEA
jgi:spore germination protein GerM